MKVLFCWARISGYMSACWRALAKCTDVDLRIIAFKSNKDVHEAPFGDDLVRELNCTFFDKEDLQSEKKIQVFASEFEPHTIFICGWAFPAYVSLAMSREMTGVKIIMCMDNPLRNTWRQRLATWKIGPLLARSDWIFVTGERSWQLAKYWKVPERKILRGLYGIDYNALSPIYEQRTRDGLTWPKRFLFVGRYVPAKGIDVLVEGYARYRASVGDPWPLVCCGTGPLVTNLSSALGLINRGFMQPIEMVEVWAQAGAFVLASNLDHWPLVIAEACAAGLPVLCTESCGSSVELVRSYFNGLIVATGDPDAIASGMRWMHGNHEKLAEMGRRSMSLGAAYGTDAWVARIAAIITNE